MVEPPRSIESLTPQQEAFVRALFDLCAEYRREGVTAISQGGLNTFVVCIYVEHPPQQRDATDDTTNLA